MASLDILIGGESFKEIREHNCCYIDKTSILPDMLGSVPPKVSLITRPRRFGKTLTMTMFQEFFDINKQSRELFSGLAVSDNRDLCAAWMNQYPTLFITLKGVEGRSFEIAKGQMAELLQRVCIEHAWLLQSRRLDAVVKKKLALLKEGQASENDLANALSLFCHALDAYWGKPVILLIDEYDVPINCAEQNGYYSEMVGFMRGFLGTALKTNPALKFAVLTGCLRIAEESIFTGLNNFRCYGLADERFADKFGFTAGEAESLLAAAGFADKGGLLREWYDGYRLGNQTEIYCP